MIVNKRFFPEVMLDNDRNFIDQLLAVIESVDELASIEISKSTDSYIFRIASSTPAYTQATLREVLTFHNLYGIKIDLSKSIKSSGSLVFKIKLDIN